MNELGFDTFAARAADEAGITESDGRAWSRGELASFKNRLGRALISEGVVPGACVALISPNCAEYLGVFLACTHIGLNVVPVNWHLSDAELSFILEDADAVVVIAHARLGARKLASLRSCSDAARLCLCIGGADRYVAVEDFIAHEDPAPLPECEWGRALAYTSATTGRPKAVLLPARDARAALEKTLRYYLSFGIPPASGNVHLCTSMLYHAGPLEGSLMALHVGHHLVLMEQMQPELLLQLIQRYRVVTSFMVPTTFVRLLKLPEDVRAKYDTTSLRRVTHSAAPCPVEVKYKMIEWWGPIIWEAYGATEGGGTAVSSADWLKYPGTVGRIPGSQVRVLDDQGGDLPVGETGLIYMTRYTGDRFEYKGDADKTRNSHRGEFFTAGDVGYLNEDGYLFICDRKIDLIISSGANIYPAEIEQALVQHPAVVDCAVVAMPDELFGEVPKAFVQIAPDAQASPAMTGELLRHLASRLAPMKLPRRIQYVSQIPRDPSGKLYKRLLRDEG